MFSKRDILEISCKVLGLFCLIQGIPYIASVLAFVTTTDMITRFSLILTVGIAAFHYIAAFILLKWAKGIAALLVGEDQPVEIKVGVGWQKLVYTLCLRVVGAVAIIRAVPRIIGAIIQITLGATSSASWVPLIIHVASLALGIYFIGGAKAVVRIAMKGSLREPDSNNV